MYGGGVDEGCVSSWVGWGKVWQMMVCIGKKVWLLCLWRHGAVKLALHLWCA